MVLHTFEQTYLSLVILFTLSCSWGLPHALIHLRQASKFVFGFGNGIKLTFWTLSGYMVSELHVPRQHLLTIFCKNLQNSPIYLTV